MCVQLGICHLLQSLVSTSEDIKEITTPPAFVVAGSWNLAQAGVNMQDLLHQTGTPDVSKPPLAQMTFSRCFRRN